MSATKSGGTASRKRAKDSAMAAAMAKDGVKRSTMRDPITRALVGIDSFYHRIGRMGGGDKSRIKG